MRIKLLTFLEEANAPYLNTIVRLRAPHKAITVKALIDTGSPRTIVAYSEALMLQIPINDLTKEEIIRLGGSVYEARGYNRLKILLKSEEGQLVIEEMPVQILKPTSPKEAMEQKFGFIIGMDFLKEKGYKLFCDVAKDIAYLEKNNS